MEIRTEIQIRYRRTVSSCSIGFSIPPRKILDLARKMDSMKEESNNSEKYLDSQLWHACAGGIVEIPPVNSKVFYFPQGHAEMAEGQLDFRTHKIPPLVLTRVSAIRFMADSQTDEVFAEICLLPLSSNDFESGADDWIGGNNQSESEEKHTSFAKTLTQSDANNGGGFFVPRYCAETIKRFKCREEGMATSSGQEGIATLSGNDLVWNEEIEE